MSNYKQRAVFKFILILGFFSSVLLGCEKNDAEVDGEISEKKEVKTPQDIVPLTSVRTELTKDSIFLYARQVYLWWQDVPDYQTFKPRNYSSLDNELYAITRFGINPETNKPYEFSPLANGADAMDPKYSYIDDVTNNNPVAYVPEKKSSVDLEGNGFDAGLFTIATGSQTAYQLKVGAVYPGSPAALAGFKRGDRLSKVGTTSIGANYNSEYPIFSSALNSLTPVTVEGVTSKGTLFTRTVKKSSYKSNPVYKDSIYTAETPSGIKKIGYISYARFSNSTNSFPEFDRIFAKFAQQGVTDLILDFRYNGGGYVNTAERLINLIAPTSLNGKVMYKEYFNELMQEGKATILAKQPLLSSTGQLQYKSDGKLKTYADIDYTVKGNTNLFQKAGTLNTVKNVVFIVSGSTASASELVINSLKPYMNIKIVGTTTYGKPVGFFPVKIDKYEVYFSMFESQNSLGQGKYYAGFTPDTGTSTADNDNPSFDFGDRNENSFAAAYNYLTVGAYYSAETKLDGVTLSSKNSTSQVLNSNGKAVEINEFKGMIQDPNKLRLK